MPPRVALVRSIESSDSTITPSFETDWWTPRLAGPVIAAAIVRLALLAAALARNGTDALFQVDAGTYLEPGRNLLLHGHFAVNGLPDLLRTPGYPLFLAITSLAGFPTAAVANVILSVFSLILVWRLGRTVFDDPRIALGAAWIFAFEPMSVLYSVCLTSETLFLALWLLSLERLAVFLRGHSLRVLATAGLWLAAATFVRPVTYYLPVALALGLFAALARVHGLRWKAPAVLLICVLPWLAAWQIRNWIETGYRGFASISEVNLYFFIAADLIAQSEHRQLLDVSKELGAVSERNSDEQTYLHQHYLSVHPEQTGWSQGQRLAFMHSEAVRVIRTHFRNYLRSCFFALLRTVFNPGEGNLSHLLFPSDSGHQAGMQDKGPVRSAILLAKADSRLAVRKLVFEVILLGLYLFAVRGIVLQARGVFGGGAHNACLWLLLGTSLYFFAVTAIGCGLGADSRLRLPVMPVVCILASAGFQRRKTIGQS